MKNTMSTKTDSQDVLAGYLAPAELCQQLGKTRRTLDRWHARGLGPPRVQIQRLILYSITDVRSWLAAHVARPGPTERKQNARKS